MRTSEEIYNETRLQCLNDNCQSLEVMAKLSIEKSQKEMFYFLYEQAENNNNLTLLEFFDKMDKELLFQC